MQRCKEKKGNERKCKEGAFPQKGVSKVWVDVLDDIWTRSG